jgi:hypothetical protein
MFHIKYSFKDIVTFVDLGIQMCSVFHQNGPHALYGVIRKKDFRLR